MTHQRGFTLIELMVALAVFAVTATVVLQQSSRSLRLQTSLEDISIATWIAQNRLAELRNARLAPHLGEESKPLTFANRQWQVTTLTEPGPHQGILQVHVTVATKDQQHSTETFLTGYLTGKKP